MAPIGSVPVSLRGPGPWRGMTTISDCERGDRKLRLIEGAMPAASGEDLRLFPGFVTAFDFVSSGRTAGYQQNYLDGGLPASSSSGDYRQQNNSPGATMKVWNKPTNLHCVANVRGQVFVIGESEFVREPILGSGSAEGFAVSWTAGANTEITLDRAVTFTQSDASPEGEFNSVAPGGGAPAGNLVTSFIYIEADAGGTLAGKIHEVTSVSNPGSVTVIVTNSDGGAGGTWTPNATISRVRPIGDNTYPKVPQPSGTDDPECLTSWRATSPGDPTGNAVTACEPANVANRIRDFGDAGLPGNVVEGRETQYWKSRRRKKALPFRVNPDAASDRLLLAAPGYGCAFQVPAMMPSNTTESWRQDAYRPRCVGVPKAIMYEDTIYTGAGGSWHVPTSGTTGYGGTNQAARQGAYIVTCCYRDDVTGEMGIAADPITITTDGSSADQGLRIGILFPGYLMSECAAMSILVFRSTKNTSTMVYQQQISPLTSYLGTAGSSGRHGLQAPTGSTENQLIEFSFPYVDDASELDGNFEPPDGLHQMPMGCKAVRVVKGQAFYGGHSGNAGSRLERLEATTYFRFDQATTLGDNLHPRRDRITMRASGATTPEPSAGEVWNVANGSLPPSYAGQRLASVGGLFPFPRQEVVLDYLTNARSGFPATLTFPVPAAHWPRWVITQTPLRAGSGWDVATSAYVVLPRGHYQVGILDKPGQTPATNTGIADDEQEDDIEAIGKLHGSTLFATRANCHILSWQDDPTLSRPTLLGPDGCIAANSMVEFAGGACWLSERGPVASFGGKPEWIGEDLQESFCGTAAKYLRDSEGLMRHAWACHDPERGCVYFGVFSNRNSTTITFRGESKSWATANDQAKSRFPCDEILIWSYRSNAWSVWYPPEGLEVQWMARWTDAQGRPRIWFLAADKRIYALDDDYAQWNRQPLVLTLSAGASGTEIALTTLGTFGDGLTNRNNDTFIANGMTAFVTDSTGQTLKGIGVVDDYDSGAGTITVVMEASATVIATDKLHLGVRRATMTSRFNNWGRNEAKALHGVSLRYSLWSSRQTSSSDPQPSGPSFVKVTSVVNQRLGSASAPSEPVRDSGFTAGSYEFLGKNVARAQAQWRLCGKGLPAGQEHSVTLDFVSCSQLRLSDAEAVVAT